MLQEMSFLEILLRKIEYLLLFCVIIGLSEEIRKHNRINSAA